ncbi:MAG: pyridoxamine 5'-phosphate oxidase family protein [Epsilonproteobacteria bacterium]|nr:pyridoxamine 5'-phosphate oxidase family protein [Campylobacterota bacterium]
MSQDLQKISAFLAKHHVMSLATMSGDELSVCSLFYAYDKQTNTFIVASSDTTTHIAHIMQNPQVAGNIYLETKIVGKIQGVQFKGHFSHAKDDEAKRIYLTRFPYAAAMTPKLWRIEVESFKMTDNTLGFGKKLLWNKTL